MYIPQFITNETNLIHIKKKKKKKKKKHPGDTKLQTIHRIPN